ncbi:MAG: hypothetical protein J7K21_05160 [Desulfurococcales archaeon]|nr:hypothetical protein [Desulfurococcales archaeon]
MGKPVVWITVSYGDIEDAYILNAVYIAMKELRKMGIEPVLTQLYHPGIRPKITVNGLDLRIDHDLPENIVSTALEILTTIMVNDNRSIIEGRIAGAIDRRG